MLGVHIADVSSFIKAYKKRFNALKEQDNYDQLYDNCKKFIKLYDRVRGTSPAELRSSGPKQRPERVATTLGVSDGESSGRDVPADEISTVRFEEHSEEEYRAHLKKFFKGNDET